MQRGRRRRLLGFQAPEQEETPHEHLVGGQAVRALRGDDRGVFFGAESDLVFIPAR